MNVCVRACALALCYFILNYYFPQDAQWTSESCGFQQFRGFVVVVHDVHVDGGVPSPVVAVAPVVNAIRG